jgi:hypothetical protein
MSFSMDESSLAKVVNKIIAFLSSVVSKNRKYDIQKAEIKLRLITYTYMLQYHHAKFSRNKISPICKLCGEEDEDRVHFLLECKTLEENIFIYILYLIKLIALPVHVSEPTLDYHIDSTTEGLNIISVQAYCPTSARI